MRVLVACEFSGVVRRAFRERGHDAWSIDLLPSEDGSPYHIQGDIRKTTTGGFPILRWQWELLIAHPPCTYLCNSGVRWIAPRGQVDKGRYEQMMNACEFFADLYHSGIPKIAIENPVMHQRYAGDYLWRIRKVPQYSQTIQPWQFGHGEIKRTCFWLRGLPPLEPTQIVEGRKARVHREPPGPDRWKNRSRTFEGIAAAMAEQWTNLKSATN